MVELEKLRAVFGYEAGAWKTAVDLYIEALRDLPYDLLREAVATSVRTAGPSDHFPKPGAIRSTVNGVLEVRRARLKRAETPREDESWPKWLEEIWGPVPQGPTARNQALAQQERRRLEPIWRGSLPPPPQAPDGDFRRISEVLGVTATEQKPKHEDPDELRWGRIELGLEEEPSHDEF